MKAWYCLCIVSISLLILCAVLVSATDFEDEEEDKDDGVVETEDKEEPPTFHKERVVNLSQFAICCFLATTFIKILNIVKSKLKIFFTFW